VDGKMHEIMYTLIHTSIGEELNYGTEVMGVL